MNKIELQKIICTHVGGDANTDNVVIVVQTDGGLPITYPVVQPHDMTTGGPDWDLTDNGTKQGPTYYYKDVITINLYDKDGELNQLDAADYLVSGWVGDVDAPENKTLSLSGAANKARYSIVYAVEPLTVKSVLTADLDTLVTRNGSRAGLGFFAQ